jgi:hypothetical protein
MSRELTVTAVVASTPSRSTTALQSSAIVALLLVGLREQTDELGRHGGRNHYTALATPLLPT